MTVLCHKCESEFNYLIQLLISTRRVLLFVHLVLPSSFLFTGTGLLFKKVFQLVEPQKSFIFVFRKAEPEIVRQEAGHLFMDNLKGVVFLELDSPIACF